MKNFKLFSSSSELETYINGSEYLEPFIGAVSQLKGSVKYNRPKLNIIRLFTQRGGITINKFLDDEMRPQSERFELKEGWNTLNMTNEFPYGFATLNGDGTDGITEVDLSSYQGSELNSGMFSETGINEVIIPDTIKEIGSKCFSECGNLNNVHFGKKIKKIGFLAFNACTKLEEINLPEGLEEIEYSAFDNVLCSNFILPSTIQKLENYFYVHSTSNSTVRFQSLVPPIMPNSPFSVIDRIEVPMAAVETYKNINIPRWKEFYGDKIVGY